MANRGGRRDVLQTLDDRELLRRYRLDRAGIMFVVDLLRDAITSPTRRHNAITPEKKVITTLRYLATALYTHIKGHLWTLQDSLALWV
jgi:hypothetical protein